MSKVIATSGKDLQTLSLPSLASEEDCAATIRTIQKLQLLCRMRVARPPFGTGALANDFEILASGQGVVVRRRGSTADLAANGSLWAPYLQSNKEFVARTGLHKECSQWGRVNHSNSEAAKTPFIFENQNLAAHPSAAAIHSEIVALVARRRRPM
jgi:hypothetical protein